MSDIDQQQQQQQNSSYSSSSKKKNNQKNTTTSSPSPSWSSSSYSSHNKEDEEEEEEEEDMQDIQLAHEHRLKIKVPPRQSSFRVVAIVFYELLHPTGAAGPTAQTTTPLPLPPQEEEEQQQQHQKSTTTTSTEDNYQTRPFVVGTNDEPCYIGGSICAERAALVQLRFLPIQKITKVVISTDAHHPVYPGMLCREFMSSHMYIDPCKVPILTAGCVCQRDGCGLCLDKQYYDDVPSSSSMDENDCVSSSSGSKKFHGWEYVKTFLTDLYPYPSPYTRLTALESVKLGMEISKHGHSWNASHSSSGHHNISSSSSNSNSFSSGGGIVVSTIEQEKDNDEEEAQELILRAIQVARETNDRSDLHPIQYAAAVKFDNGAIYTASQRKTLEYGCSVDAITQLASSLLLLIPPLTTTTTATGTTSTVHHLLNTNNSCTSTTAVVRPRLIVQVDQYGVIHAPFAAARAFLSEYGFGDCRVIIQKDVAPMMSTSSSSSSSTGHESHEEDHDSNMIVQVVTVKDIAPYMPDLGRLHQG